LETLILFKCLGVFDLNGTSTKNDASTSINGFSTGIVVLVKKPMQQAAITAEKDKPISKTLAKDSNLHPR
jgi:hypothetical protein